MPRPNGPNQNQNHLLSTLLDAEFSRLAPHLELIPMLMGDVLYESGEKLQHARDFVSKPFDLVEGQTRIHNMLEVRLLYQKLAQYNRRLEQKVLECTAQLRESEARFKSFTELSCDFYWEQDAQGKFTRTSGPVLEMLGIAADDLVGVTGATVTGWNSDD